MQLWLPDTSTPEFAAQVAHDIAVLKAAEETASPDERAMVGCLGACLSPRVCPRGLVRT